MEAHQFHPFDDVIVFISLFINFSCVLGAGGGKDYKQQYLSNCNRPLYLAGVINAFTAITPLLLHVHMSNVSNIKIC